VAFAAYALFTVLCTWPWLRDPAHTALPYSDLLGHVWGLAWVVHQAVRDPLHLYDANMYWPQTLSLAYTESLIPQALQAAPVFAAGGSALLAHNLVLLLTFPLAGCFAYLLAWDLTRSRAASFLAGLAFGFSALRFLHIVHIGVLSFQWLPLILWLVRRAVLRPRPPVLVALAGALVVQALSSGYYAVLLALLLAVVAPFFARRAWRRRSLGPLLLAGVGALLVVAALAWPYAVLQQRHGLGRGRDTFVHWSATPASYLSPGEYVGLPHLEALREATGSWPLFPGTAVLLLAPLGLGRSRSARLALALSLAGIALSFGPELRLGALSLPMPLEWLRRMPPGSLLRDPARLGVLAQLGLALLAALGLRRVLRWRGGAWAAAALLALQIAEAYPVGLGNRVRAVTPPPVVLRFLAGAPRGPVLELPWDHTNRGAGGQYLYWSTAHWQPLVNGHGTFAPSANFRLAVLAARFPTGRSSRILRAEGVRYVVVHEERGAEERASPGLPPGVRLAARAGTDSVYEIDPVGEREARPAQAAEPEHEDPALLN
jgi:hypothetical protein